MFLAFLGWYWEGGGAVPATGTGGAVLRALRRKREAERDEREREEARYYAALAESLPPSVERVVERVAVESNGNEWSAKRAQRALRDAFAELEAEMSALRSAQALLIMYRRVAAQVVVDDEARRAADEAEAARIMRNRRIAAILLSAE